MSRSARRAATAALAAGLLGAGTAVVVASSSDATTINRRPICNDIGFNQPTTVGGTVTIPVLDVAADPDLTPVRLVEVFGGAPVGSALISNNALVFTRTTTTRTSVYLYWTVSDGALTAQCVASAFDRPPTDG
jgi:hypothetical protein